MGFGRHSIAIDPSTETERIVAAMQQGIRTMKRRGAVLGISGGVDSAVVLALCVRAFTPHNTIAVMLPEKESDPDSLRLASDLAAHYGVTPVLEDITQALEGFGCYRRRDAAMARVIPQYNPALGYKAKIVLPQNLLDESKLNVFTLTVIGPDGETFSAPLGTREFLEIVAASNFKQRTRMAMLYHYAELNNYAMIGTPNKNEHDQGFFVKYGDSAMDIKPIGHLYKTQIYQLAEYLGVPEEIRRRQPTSDTYSAPCTQQEFFFRLPFETMDLLWYAQENDVPINEVATSMGLTEEQVQRAFNDFRSKRRATEYLRMPPLEIGRTQAASS